MSSPPPSARALPQTPHRRRHDRISIALALLLATAGCGQHGEPGNATMADSAAREGAAAPTESPGPVALLIRTAAGRAHPFTVELAVDDVSQQQGLMGRTTLAGDGGMLFPFPLPRMASFWMKDTPLPLDLLFIRPDGTIAAILPGQPDDLHPIAAGEPVSAVLEIAQGRAAALGLAPGDRVQWGDCAGSGGPSPSATPWRPDHFCPAGPD